MNLARRNRSLSLTIHSAFIQIRLLDHPSKRDCQVALDDLAHLFDVGGLDASLLKRGDGVSVPLLANTDQAYVSARVLMARGFCVAVLDGRTAYEVGDIPLT